MIHFSWSFKLFQWPAIQFIAVGLMTTGAGPLFVAEAQARDDYRQCADELTESGINAETAAAACALAFNPTVVSDCVDDVVASSPVSPEAALSACSRDRRPDEVATCVDDIHDQLEVSDSNSVLRLCHLSLLPERYSACVTGLAEALEYSVEESLSRCIAAGYRPENITPTFIPRNPANQ